MVIYTPLNTEPNYSILIFKYGHIKSVKLLLLFLDLNI